MFFYASKIIWFFIQPSGFCVFLIIIGLALSKTRWARWAKRMTATGAVLLALIAFSPLGRLLITPLEDRFTLPQAGQLDKLDLKGLVVLGGTVNMPITDARGAPALVSGAERIIEAVRLARRYESLKILLVGGPNTVLTNPTPDAEIVKKIMVDLGIPRGRIITEPRSRNTYQNAARTRELGLIRAGEEKQWLLITSAYHMPRAVGCFRQNGLNLTPYPVNYMTGGQKTLYKPFYYAMDGITLTDLAVKEWLGLLAYRVSGRLSGLFPAPGID